MIFFINMLFGHLFGDFIFQPKWMALQKSKSSDICFLHCSIYTACVVAFTQIWNPLWIAIVFLSHFAIDRFSLSDKWMKLMKGRSLEDFYWNGHKDIPKTGKVWEGFTEVGKGYEEWKVAKNYQILTGGFSAVCYTVIDNTFHLVINYYSLSWAS